MIITSENALLLLLLLLILKVVRQEINFWLRYLSYLMRQVGFLFMHISLLLEHKVGKYNKHRDKHLDNHKGKVSKMK